MIHLTQITGIMPMSVRGLWGPAGLSCALAYRGLRSWLSTERRRSPSLV
jgi:hypothetical protein